MFAENSETVLKPKILVFGVGGAGGNAVNNMIASELDGVTFVVANTDAQALENARTEHKIQLGTRSTKGLGAGAMPQIGEAAAEESSKEIRHYLDGANLVFITAGMGGGTGTGAAPVIAKIAKEMGILTVGVVTKPFLFEGAHRMAIAEEGLRKLRDQVDTLIIIANQNLFRIANERTTFMDAFKIADNVLRDGVCGIVELIIMDGLVNLDLADIATIMKDGGPAMMGTGACSEEENRSVIAAERAISNPLLDRVSIGGASRVLINITGGMDMTLFEVDAAANRIRDEINNSNANIIFGSTFKQELEGSIVVSVFATGLEDKTNSNPTAAPDKTHDDVKKAPANIVETTNHTTDNAPKPQESQNILRPKEVARSTSQADVYDIPAFLRKIKNNKAE
jgi:cell division protein FtsZ